MKRISHHLLLIGWLVAGTGLLRAQPPPMDLLYRLDRSTIKAKISDVTGSDVFYAELTTPNASRKIRKAELWKIVFSDGTSDVFNDPVDPNGNSSTVVKSQPPARQQPARQKPVRQASISSADQPVGPRSIIKYAPLSSFGYERVLPNNHSMYGGISLYSLGFGVTAIGLKGEYRFYGLVKSSPKQAPQGLWIAPTALFWSISVRDVYIEETESAFVAQLGGIAGYQWVFNNKISLEPALGLSLTAVGSGTESILGAGFVPLFAVRVGYVLK